MTYAIPVQCLRLPSASSCRHPRMGARSTRFITLATCSSRLSGSGNLQNCTYRPKLEKRITMNNYEKLKMHERASQFKLPYCYLTFPFSFFLFFVFQQFSYVRGMLPHCYASISLIQFSGWRETGSTSLSWLKLSFS